MTAALTTLTPDDVVNVRKRSDGSSVYGLYLTILLFDTVTEALATEERYFLARSMLCKYTRGSGTAKAPWQAYPLDSYTTARELLEMCLQRHTANEDVRMVITTPILVELNRTDIEALAEGKQPYSRHDGQRTFERIHGTVTDTTLLMDWA